MILWQTVMQLFRSFHFFLCMIKLNQQAFRIIWKVICSHKKCTCTILTCVSVRTWGSLSHLAAEYRGACVVCTMKVIKMSHNYVKDNKLSSKLMLFYFFPSVSGLPTCWCTTGCLSTFRTLEWTSTWPRWSLAWWRCLLAPSSCSLSTAPARSPS